MKNEHRYQARLVKLIGILAMLALTTTAPAQDSHEGFSIQFDQAEDASGQSEIGRDDDGPYLVITQDMLLAWDILKRGVALKGIPVVDDDARALSLQTDWILWNYAGAKGNLSKLFTNLADRERQRYRFEFLIDADSNPDRSRIRIVRAMYQSEVDMTPDSTYTWHEWQDRTPAPGFGEEFLRLMQASFGSAMVSRIATPDVVPTSSTETTQRAEAIPLIIPIELRQSVDGRAETSAVPRQTAHANTESAKLRRRTQQPEPVRAAAPLLADPSGNVLIIQAPVDLAWRALLRSVKAQDIAIDFKDDNQRMLTTAWTEMKYSKKSRQLGLLSNAGKRRWAFGVFGDGIQQHRFQLVLLPYKQGQQALVYAYHTGAREQIDQTPDSSQTMLSWENRGTSADVAGAFLRKLRVELGSP